MIYRISNVVRTGAPVALALTLALAAAPAWAGECAAPEAPTLPDGSTATTADMSAAIKSFKTYQAALIDYRSCIDGEVAALEKAAKDKDDEEAAAESMAQQKVLVDAYNASVDDETVLANRFNEEIRAYKAAQAEASE